MSTSPPLLPASDAARLSVQFLGSGTSTGVPMIGCNCEVCRSPDLHDKRLRPSIYVTTSSGRTILVDTTPDMRTQVLRAGIERVDAVLMTHTHADHLFGMDDIRQFNWKQQAVMPIYGTDETLAHVRRVFDYCFKETQQGGGKPQLDLVPITPYEPFTVCGVTVTPVIVLHGSLPVVAYKFGERFAYVTDVSHIPDEARPYLRNLDTLVLGTVRYEPHATHFGLYQALDEIAEFTPRRAFLTHLGHHFLHDRLARELPPGVAPGYDGLIFTVGALPEG